MTITVRYVRAVEVRHLGDRVEATVTASNARGREHTETWVLPSDGAAEVAYRLHQCAAHRVKWKGEL